jgi:hypothetical protein
MRTIRLLVHTSSICSMISDDRTGYPDFYPLKGTEEEYNLTEKAITEGFENKPLVPVPTRLAALIYSRVE